MTISEKNKCLYIAKEFKRLYGLKGLVAVATDYKTGKPEVQLTQSAFKELYKEYEILPHSATWNALKTEDDGVIVFALISKGETNE